MSTKIWDLTSGILLSSYTPPKLALKVKFTPDGDQLQGLIDSTCIFKNATSAATELQNELLSKPISTISISQNGKFIVTSFNNVLQMIDIKTSYSSWIFSMHDELVSSIDISPNNQFVLSCDMKGKVYLINAINGKLLQSIGDHYKQIFSVAFSKCSNQFITGGKDKIARLYKIDQDTKTAKLLTLQQRHEDLIVSVAISNSNKYIVTGGQDRNVILWNFEGDRLIQQNGHTACVTSVKFSPHDKFVISAALDGRILVHTLNSDKLVWELKGHTQTVWDMDVYLNVSDELKIENTGEESEEIQVSEERSKENSGIQEKIKEYIKLSKQNK